jgi:hypothetical protein
MTRAIYGAEILTDDSCLGNRLSIAPLPDASWFVSGANGSMVIRLGFDDPEQLRCIRDAIDGVLEPPTKTPEEVSHGTHSRT